MLLAYLIVSVKSKDETMLRPALPTYKTLLFMSVCIASLCAGNGCGGSVCRPSSARYQRDRERVPATIGVSPDYPTVIEFGGMDIESVEASEGGQILAEVGGSTLSILANREDVNTEFAVSLIGGPYGALHLRL